MPQRGEDQLCPEASLTVGADEFELVITFTRRVEAEGLTGRGPAARRGSGAWPRCERGARRGRPHQQLKDRLCTQRSRVLDLIASQMRHSVRLRPPPGRCGLAPDDRCPLSNSPEVDHTSCGAPASPLHGRRRGCPRWLPGPRARGHSVSKQPLALDERQLDKPARHTSGGHYRWNVEDLERATTSGGPRRGRTAVRTRTRGRDAPP